MAAGLAGYAVWRFLAAATYTGNRDESAAKVRLKRLGYIEFLTEPRDEPYGRFAVFVDVAGNKWDLLGPR